MHARLPTSGRALDDTGLLVREYAAWALDRVGTARAREALRRVRGEVETDVSARDELRSTSTPTFSCGRCGAWCAQTHYPTTEWWST